jgi:hypothetical protein
MNLNDQAMKLLAATDSTVYLTYSEYARERIAAGGGRTAITADEWDTLLALAGGRKLQATFVVSQIMSNMRTAAKR